MARYVISWPSTPEQSERARSFTRADESADPSAIYCEITWLRSVREPRRSSAAECDSGVFRQVSHSRTQPQSELGAHSGDCNDIRILVCDCV